MSTRSNIARLNPDGSLDVIYCHWDGYLTGVGLELVLNYADTAALDALIGLGDISYLEESIDLTKERSANRVPRPAKHFESLDVYAKWLQETNSWVEYVYVGKAIEHPRDFFPTIEWYVAYNYNEGELTFAAVPSPYRVLQEFNEKLETVTESAL